jgi:hypothetical protein
VPFTFGAGSGALGVFGCVLVCEVGAGAGGGDVVRALRGDSASTSIASDILDRVDNLRN